MPHIQHLDDVRSAPITSGEGRAHRCHSTINRLIDGFARNHIEDIMACFSENAVYQDVRGSAPSGETFQGKESIRIAFETQFRLLGEHTYESPVIIADEQSGFARWTLILGDPSDLQAPRFDGIDHFLFDDEGLCTSKTAWLKAQPQLARARFTQRPIAALGALLRG